MNADVRIALQGVALLVGAEYRHIVEKGLIHSFARVAHSFAEYKFKTIRIEGQPAGFGVHFVRHAPVGSYECLVHVLEKEIRVAVKHYASAGEYERVDSRRSANDPIVDWDTKLVIENKPLWDRLWPKYAELKKGYMRWWQGKEGDIDGRVQLNNQWVIDWW
jgi:hypothetical protein